MHPVAIQDPGTHLVPQSLKNQMVIVSDPEIGRQNPCENKQLKLARSVTRGVIDHDLKPSAVERKGLLQILEYLPTRTLNGEERQLLWKFRFYLSTEKKFPTKFFRCVDWSDAQEAKQAVDVMHAIDKADALELLSPAFDSEEVCGHALDVLEKQSDEDLQSYLLQLVQGLRFERSVKSRLAYFLVRRAVRNPELANFFRWYVNVELCDHAFTKRFWISSARPCVRSFRRI